MKAPSNSPGNGPGNSGEYARSAVPQSATVAWWKIAMVKIGVVIALPAFISGAEMGFSMGLPRSALAIFMGAFVLAVLAAFTGTIAARSHLSTALIAEHAFGRKGARAVGVVLAVTLLVWFAVTAALFGKSLNRILAEFFGLNWGASVHMVIGGVLMVITTVYGFNALQKVADLAVPVLFLGLIGMAYFGIEQAAPGVLMANPAHGPSLGYGMSAVIGSLAAGITIFPDMARFARTPGHAQGAAFATYALALPAVLILAAIPSVATGERDLIMIMTGLGLGVPAFAFLLLAAWTTNSGNLYSSSLGIATSFERLPFKSLAATLGAIGIGLSLSGISESLIPLFVLVSTTIPPIAGIYIADFFIVRRGAYASEAVERQVNIAWPAFVAWGMAAAVGISAAQGIITLSRVAAIDAIATAFIAYVALACLNKRIAAPRQTSQAG
jgi:cytosine permease